MYRYKQLLRDAMLLPRKACFFFLAFKTDQVVQSRELATQLLFTERGNLDNYNDTVTCRLMMMIFAVFFIPNHNVTCTVHRINCFLHKLRECDHVDLTHKQT